MFRRGTLILGVLCLLFSGVGFAWGGVQYTVTDLGALPGYPTSTAYGINASGQVVGDSGWHAFLYSNGSMTDLNSLIDPASGWTLHYAFAINDSGQIVGTGNNSLRQAHAFLLTPTPEPSTLALLAAGAGSLLLMAWRRRKLSFRGR